MIVSKQVFLSPAGGKRLIALALSRQQEVLKALEERTVVIVAGTTNAYLAQELLKLTGEKDFPLHGFFRGIIRREAIPKDIARVSGDVVITHGVWQRGRTIHDVGDSLQEGDLIFKGANAVDLQSGEAAVLAGNPTSGTMGVIYRAVVGRRARLITPVGVEKRVDGPISTLCALCNAPGAVGERLAPSFGTVFTELDAIRSLSGTEPHLVAAGGVCGCEGGAFFQCTGSEEQIIALREWIARANREPVFSFSSAVRG